MASSEKGKKLSDLLVIELRNYLKQRQLDHIGTKAVLAERLQQAIISEGEDPNTYLFTIDKTVNMKMETHKEKEQMSEAVLSISDEHTNEVEDKSSDLEIDESISETNFDETPMEIEIAGNVSGKSESEISTPSDSVNVHKNVDDKDKMELEAEINESFVLMIDELISEKFLEDTQNNATGEPDFVDANDVKLDEIEEDKGENPAIGLDDEPEEDPLYVEPLQTEDESLNNNDFTVINSNKFEEINNEPNVQGKICSKELIVVVKRENFIKNKRKLVSQQSNDVENILPQDIKIKEEIIILSDDDMNSEENMDFQTIKQESTENIETKTNESKIEELPNGETKEMKSDVLEQEETTLNGESHDSSLDKENSLTTKQGIYNLKIENLISSVKAQELRQLLCNYAKVLEVKVFHDNKKIYCHAFAKVEANDLDEMLEKLNTLEYKGTVLSVAKINGKNNASANKEIQRMRSIKGLQRKKLEGEEKIESKELDRNLWVTNLLQNTKAQDIKQLLSQHAKVIGVKVVKSSSDPSKNCYGYVTLESKNDVDLCIQRLDKTTYNGRVIRLSATKKAPVLDSVTDKNVKKSPEMDSKGSNILKPSDKKKTLEKNPKKSDDLPKDDKRNEGIKESHAKNRSDRERHQREKDRFRLEEERARQDVEHAREILQRQREEARLLEREREKIRKEREYLERQRMEILRMERERQRIEREKIEKEKEELRRQQQKLEEARRAEKRASSSNSSSIPNKRPYISPKRDKTKKTETHDFSKENEDPVFPKRHGEYSKRIDKYSKRTEDFQKRSEDYPKRSSDFHKRLDDYPKRSEIYPRRADDYPKRVTEDFPKRFDHYTKPDEMYVKEDYHKRPEFTNYKREDRTIGVDFKRDYPGHPSHHVPSAVNNSGYKFETTYHPDRDKLIRQPARKDIPTKESKPVGYNDRTEITSTEAYRSIIRDDRDRERKSGVDYSYKNDNRMPLLKETPRYKDDGSPWAAGAAPVKTFRDVENPNTPKDTWWRKWDGQWSAGTSTEYPGVNYNSGPACPPPPGINNYPINNHFGNYRKY